MKKIVSLLLVIAIAMAFSPFTAKEANAYEVRDEIPVGDISNAEIILQYDTAVYDGFFKAPPVTVLWNGKKLLEYSDYEVTYDRDPNAGVHTVTITGKYNLVGSVTKTFTITPCPIADFTLSTDTYSYTGKKIIPYISFTEDECAPVCHTNCKDVGTHSVTYNFIGNYSGAVKKEFTILPSPPENVKQTKIKKDGFTLSWKKFKGASYYAVTVDGKTKNVKKNSFTYKDKSKKQVFKSIEIRTVCKVDGKKYEGYKSYASAFKLPKKPSVTVKSIKEGFEVHTKVDSSYYYQYSTSKKFKKIEGQCEFSGTYSGEHGLKSGKTMYVRVRMQGYADKKYVSKWSKTIKVKIG